MLASRGHARDVLREQREGRDERLLHDLGAGRRSGGGRARDRRAHAHARGPEQTSLSGGGEAPAGLRGPPEPDRARLRPGELRLPERLGRSRWRSRSCSDCGYRTARRVGGIVSPNWCPSAARRGRSRSRPRTRSWCARPAFGSGEITLAAMQNVITQAEFARRLGAARLPRRVRDGHAARAGSSPSTLAALLDWLAPRRRRARSCGRCAKRSSRPPPPVGPDTSIGSKPPATTTSERLVHALLDRDGRDVRVQPRDAADWAPAARRRPTRARRRLAHLRACAPGRGRSGRPVARDVDVDDRHHERPTRRSRAARAGRVTSGAASFDVHRERSGCHLRVQAGRRGVGGVHFAEGLLGPARTGRTRSPCAARMPRHVDESPATRTWTVNCADASCR